MIPPGPEQRLLALAPKAKLGVGVALAVAGAGSGVWLWERGWLAGLPILAFVAGLLTAWTGLQEPARPRAIETEVARARAEWDELRAGVAAAVRDGRSVARYLQQRGYREFGVRRWIADELAAEE